jgi:assimilatory nitrate reductase catalytic subunit
MKEVRTTCPYCGVGCGVIAQVADDGAVKIIGDPDHPANFGKLCSKGLALAETLVPTGRLRHPMIDGERASWDAAISRVADAFSTAISNHGPDSVALYVSGQLLTEDYYVANKFMKGFVGSANIDTNSRLCMASAVAAHKRAFGADVVPCSYTDLEEADLVVLVGSNAAWCHPVLFQRLLVAREKRGTKIVVIDPRRTASADSSDLFLPLAPQSDVALFNGLLRHLYLNGHSNTEFTRSQTQGLSEALLAAREWTMDAVATSTRLPVQNIRRFYDLFATTKKTVTAFSMGVNQSASGTDKANAIINVHLATGRINKPGMGPFSLTGQPNAMGGREVGGLANVLAAHMAIENPEHRNAVQLFWQSPKMVQQPGLKAVDLFRAVHEGRIKALWIMGTNPAVSMPESDFIAEALKLCDFVAVSDVMADTETTQYADVLLPAQGWGEKDGTVTNSERCISRQRNFMPAEGEARPDWCIICDVAKTMGFAGFAYDGPAAIFAEDAALTRVNNEGQRRLDLSWWRGMDYDALSPTQWGGVHPFSDGQFQTANGRAQFVPTLYKPPESSDTVLNTGRIRDQWHTMTRTGLVPRLFSHRAEPHIETNPVDAAAKGISAADIVELSNEGSRVLARALLTDAVMPGQVFQPMHWSSVFARRATVNSNCASITDPVSGQPALKSGSVQISRYAAAWFGFGVSTTKIVPHADYFSVQPLEHGFAFECADTKSPSDWQDFVTSISATVKNASIVLGPTNTSFKCAVIKDGKLAFAFFAAASPVSASRTWLHAQLGKEATALQILAARPAPGQVDKGPIICACLQVGKSEIIRCAKQNPNFTEKQIFETSRAGTGCGTCRSDVRRILAVAKISKLQSSTAVD